MTATIDNRTALEWGSLDERAVDVSRALAMDAVEAAGSGHPGTRKVPSSKRHPVRRSRARRRC